MTIFFASRADLIPMAGTPGENEGFLLFPGKHRYGLKNYKKRESHRGQFLPVGPPQMILALILYCLEK